MEDRNLPCYEDEIDLIDILRVIWRWKLFIIVFVIFATALAAAFTMVKHPTRTGCSAVLFLSFPGVEKGVYPDGSAVDERTIITPAVVSTGVSKMKDIDRDRVMANWRDIIEVSAVTPKAEKKKKAGIPVYPDMFEVRVFCNTPEGDEILSIDQAERLLVKLVDEYKNLFWQKFIEMPIFPEDLSTQGLGDPFAAIEFLKSRADHMVVKIDTLPYAAVSHVSAKTGRSIADIKHEIISLEDYAFENLKRIALKVIGGEIVEKDTELEKLEKEKLAEAKAARDLLDNYFAVNSSNNAGAANSYAGITDLSPSYIGITNLLPSYAGITDLTPIENIGRVEAFRFLIEKAFNAESAAKSIQIKRRYLQRSYYDSKKSRENGSPGINSFPELESLGQKLANLGRQLNSIYIDYKKAQLGNTIRVISRKKGFVVTRMKIIIALSMVASLFFAVFLAFFIEYMKNAAKKQGNA